MAFKKRLMYCFCCEGFITFLSTGAVLEVAVAFVLGAAFKDMITALVKDLFTPCISAIVGDVDFASLKFTVNGSEFLYGDFLNYVISFILIAFCMYWFVVVPVSAVQRYRKQDLALHKRECPYCYCEIRTVATRCGFCTQPVSPTILKVGNESVVLEGEKTAEELKQIEKATKAEQKRKADVKAKKKGEKKGKKKEPVVEVEAEEESEEEV